VKIRLIRTRTAPLVTTVLSFLLLTALKLVDLTDELNHISLGSYHLTCRLGKARGGGLFWGGEKKNFFFPSHPKPNARNAIALSTHWLRPSETWNVSAHRQFLDSDYVAQLPIAQ